MNFFLKFDPYSTSPWDLISVQEDGYKCFHGNYSTIEDALRQYYYNTNKHPTLQIVNIDL